MLQLNQLGDDGVLTRFHRTKGGGVTVLLRIAAKMIETRVPQARPFRRFGIDFLKVAKHGVDRRVETVKIHPVESNRRPLWIEILVETTQPFNEFDDDRVAPHPGWEPAKTRKRLVRARGRHAPRVPVNAS